MRINQEILKGISVKYPNFKLSIKDGMIYQELECFVNIFKLFFHKHQNCIVIEPYMWLQAREVEAIYRKFTFVPKKEHHNTFTIGGNVGILMDEENQTPILKKNQALKLAINQESEVEEIKESLGYCFEHAALDYFSEYSSLDIIDEVLNEYPLELCTHSILYPIRCTKAIIVAKLVDNPAKNELVIIYEKELLKNKVNQQFLKEFLEVKQYLYQ